MKSMNVLHKLPQTEFLYVEFFSFIVSYYVKCVLPVLTFMLRFV